MPNNNPLNNISNANFQLLTNLVNQVATGQITDPTLISYVQTLQARAEAGTLFDNAFTQYVPGTTTPLAPVPPNPVYNSTDTTDNPTTSNNGQSQPTQPTTTTPTGNTPGTLSVNTTQSNSTTDPAQGNSNTAVMDVGVGANDAYDPKTGDSLSTSTSQQYASGATTPPASINPQGCGSAAIFDKRLAIFRTQDKVLWFFWVDNIFGLLPSSTPSISSLSTGQTSSQNPTTIVTGNI